MGGGTDGQHDPNSDQMSHSITSSEIVTHLDGVTNEQTEKCNTERTRSTTQTLLNNVVLPAKTMDTTADTLMDGVTQVTVESSPLPELDMQTNNKTELLMARDKTEITSVRIPVVDGVTLCAADTEQHLPTTNSNNDLFTTDPLRDVTLDGVTPGTSITEQLLPTANNSNLPTMSTMSTTNTQSSTPMGGVTLTSVETSVRDYTISEILSNNDFPEKSLILGGVTSNIQDMTQESSMETNPTLPDLVRNRTKDGTKSPKSLQRKKTPTKRLLDVFGSPIPSELEDEASKEHLQGYQTTEDEDDAIDGLLALSKQTLEPERSEKDSRSPNLDSTGKNRTKGKEKNKKSKAHNKAKKGKNNKVVTTQIEKRLEEMNINERKSRTTKKMKPGTEDTVEKDTMQSATRKRRDDSCNSPGSSPGIFKLTHHKLRRKENKEKSYKCGQCTQKAKNMEELKKHYARKHKKALCSVCNRTFDLDIILARHNYTHYEKRYFCKKCKEGFYFASELKKHKVSHAKTPSFQCMVAGCGKWFKRVAEVNVHMEVHKNKTWKCDLCKDFSTSCEKYLKDHYRTDHNPNSLPYGCTDCGKGFKYRMQLKRHSSDKSACSKNSSS